MRISQTFLSALLIGVLLTTTAYAQNPRIIEIEGYDRMRYSKNEIKASPGEKLKVVMITVSNLPKESMAHNWVLLKKGVDAKEFSTESAQHPDNGYIKPGAEDKIIARTDMVGGGNRDAVTFTTPTEPGEYTYVCTFPGHYLAGMKGTLIVK